MARNRIAEENQSVAANAARGASADECRESKASEPIWEVGMCGRQATFVLTLRIAGRRDEVHAATRVTPRQQRSHRGGVRVRSSTAWTEDADSVNTSEWFRVVAHRAPRHRSDVCVRSSLHPLPGGRSALPWKHDPCFSSGGPSSRGPSSRGLPREGAFSRWPSLECLSSECLPLERLPWNVFPRNAFFWNAFLGMLFRGKPPRNAFLWNASLECFSAECLPLECLPLQGFFGGPLVAGRRTECCTRCSAESSWRVS